MWPTSELETVYIFGTIFEIRCVNVVHLNSDAEFSLEIVDLCVDVMKLTTEKADPHTWVFPNTLTSNSRVKYRFLDLKFSSSFALATSVVSLVVRGCPAGPLGVPAPGTVNPGLQEPFLSFF